VFGIRTANGKQWHAMQVPSRAPGASAMMTGVGIAGANIFPPDREHASAHGLRIFTAQDEV
jgi:hypothetical protein